MATEDEQNEARRIIELSEGFMKSQVLLTSLKFGIFDILEKSTAPMGAAGISAAIEADADATKRLLNACAGLGLLQKVNVDKETGDGEYKLTNSSRAFLTSSSPSSLRDRLLFFDDMIRPGWENLSKAVKEGAAYSTPYGLERDKTFDDAYSTRNHVMIMSGMAREPTIFGARTASAFNLEGFQSICDLGGCTGPLAFHLAAAYPKASVSVFDLPVVVKVAEDSRPESQHAQRVSFIPGDFFQDPLPPADLYVLCRVLHDWTEDKVVKLLTKVYESLPPGGGVLIAEHMLDDDKAGPEVSTKMDLTMMVCTGGRERTGNEFKRLLIVVGFTEVSVKANDYPLGHVLARKQRA